jgi:hypothetical protein
MRNSKGQFTKFAAQPEPSELIRSERFQLAVGEQYRMEQESKQAVRNAIADMMEAVKAYWFIK